MSIHPSLTSLPVRDRKGRTLWQLNEKVRVKLAPRWYVEVPEGYTSNLGTVPWYARVLVSPDEFPGPFVLHDWMCNEDVLDDGEQLDSGYTRWQADATLYHTLSTHEPTVPAWKCWIIWFAVRVNARTKGLK